MAYYLQPDELAVAEPHLTRIGALMGGPVARWAEETDRNPPRLERYDRWGHDVSRVVMPTSFDESRRAVLDAQKAAARRRPRRRHEFVAAAVRVELSAQPGRYRDGLRARHRRRHGEGVWSRRTRQPMCGTTCWPSSSRVSGKGETAQLLTERTGGSDLGALETTATRNGDAWLLNGFKWFASNCNGEAFVVLAKPEGAPDTSRGVATFLVLRTRRDGSRNGVRVRRLKDKLGTRSVASGEIEFVDAEAFLLSGEASERRGPVRRQGPGPDDGADERRTPRHRAVRARQCAARPGRVAVLRPAAPGVRRRPDRQAVDAAQAGRDDRRRRSRAGARVRRHRRGQPPAAAAGPSAHRRARHQAEGLPARHHHGVRCDRNPRRQRLYRDLAGGTAAARRAGEHHLGGPRQHPLPRRASAGSSARRPTSRYCNACTMRCRCPTPTTPPLSLPAASRTSMRPSPHGASSTARSPRPGCSRSRSSWVTCTPVRC